MSSRVSPLVQDSAARVLVRAVWRGPRQLSDGAGRGRPQRADAASARGAESADTQVLGLQLLQRLPLGLPHQVPSSLPSGQDHPPGGRGHCREVSAGGAPCGCVPPPVKGTRCGLELDVTLGSLVFFSRFSCYTTQYTARWAHESEFSRILIGPKMLTDHMPDILMRALDSIVSDRATCISCPAQGGPHVDMV